jgi:hypothetical protein
LRRKARHGRDDITIITREQMIDVLGSVLGVLRFAVGDPVEALRAE